MTVSELIEVLQTYPSDMVVGYRMYSEQCVLDKDDIKAETNGVPRADGWIQDYRSDMPSQTCLIFPGN